MVRVLIPAAEQGGRRAVLIGLRNMSERKPSWFGLRNLAEELRNRAEKERSWFAS
jgi:hypothetical protein